MKYAILCITSKSTTNSRRFYGDGIKLSPVVLLSYSIRLYSRELAATKVLLNVSRSDAGNQRVEKTARPSFR